jgi:hypothetical protein
MSTRLEELEVENACRLCTSNLLEQSHCYLIDEDLSEMIHTLVSIKVGWRFMKLVTLIN